MTVPMPSSVRGHPCILGVFRAKRKRTSYSLIILQLGHLGRKVCQDETLGSISSVHPS